MADQSNFPEKMDLRSMDISAEKRAKLKQLFPSVFTETRNEKGELVESIDFEKLKAELGKFSDVFEARRERYGMDWPGKKDAMKLIQQPSVGTLKPCREESVEFDATGNMFIEGDNLEVLKLLQKAYYGRVKMMCLDPPYNTGKEFIYPDNFSETLDTYLSYAGLTDDMGRKFSTNTPNEGRFHTKWLNMMYPRLYLARNLLRDDGVIFISIDDNEVSNLRKLCDEIFGEENLLGTFQWKRRQRADSRNQSNVSSDHEYILAYSKSELAKFIGYQIDTSKYRNPDSDPRGPWASIDLSGLATKTQRPNLHYEIIDPETGNSYPPNPNRGWSKSEEKVKRMIAEGRILFPKTPTGRPREKKFLNELNSTLTGFSTCLDSKYVGYTTNGTREVSELLNGKYFDFPKPSSLIRTFIEQTVNLQDIILDFFSGSCTTAHAVLDLNKHDNGNRQFIMVQLPEPCDENSEAFKAGYKTIADIGKERIRRVIKKIETEQSARAKKAAGELPGMATEKPPALDLGFKVFKLDKSNFKIWDGADPDISEEKLARQLELFVEHIDPKSSAEDVLCELLLKAGFKLTEPVKKKQLAGKTVFSVADGALLIFLEDNITRELIDAVAEAEPFRFICLDRAFKGNDQLKANAVQTFEARNQGRDKTQQIVFRTV